MVAVANVALLHRWVIANAGVPSNAFGTAEVQALRGAGLRGSSLLVLIAVLALTGGIGMAIRALWGRGYPVGTAESRATSAA